MEHIFKGKHLNFTQRIKNQLDLPLAFLFLAILFPILYQRNPLNYQLMIFTGIIFFILCFFANRNAKKYVNEIKVTERTIILIGQTYNEKWESKFELINTTLNFKRRGSRFNPEYILTINLLDGLYEINEYHNWNYSSLIELYELIKLLKHEKTILDEEFMLNNIRKKINA